MSNLLHSQEFLKNVVITIYICFSPKTLLYLVGIEDKIDTLLAELP